MKRKKVEELNKEEKEQLVEKLFNSKDELYDEYHIADDQVVRDKKKGTLEFLNKELVALIKEAMDDNREVRYNLSENLVFIKKDL